jgi:hypothetical protein
VIPTRSVGPNRMPPVHLKPPLPSNKASDLSHARFASELQIHGVSDGCTNRGGSSPDLSPRGRCRAQVIPISVGTPLIVGENEVITMDLTRTLRRSVIEENVQDSQRLALVDLQHVWRSAVASMGDEIRWPLSGFIFRFLVRLRCRWAP